ncbi:uncharacterized protein HaLaN_23171, partial [Haematococcus lacustris]
MELLTKASVLEHLMRRPHHRGIRLLPGEVAVFEQPNSAWPVAMLKQLDEDNRRKYDSLSSVLHRESSVLLAEARTAIEDVRRELRVQAASSSKLSGMEARLSSLEGSVLSAGRAVREAGTGLAAVPDRLQRELRAQFDAIVTAVRSEAMRASMTRSSEEGAALAQLSSQLAVGGQVMWGSAALNGALTGLEVAQGEGLRRMTLTLSSNLVDAEAALQ